MSVSPPTPSAVAPSAVDRRCEAVEIPPGPQGMDALLPALTDAMAGIGPAIAPIPVSGSDAYRARMRAALRPGDPVPAEVAAVVSTSGSTGDPAGVLLPTSALRAAAAGFARRVGVPEGHRWVATLPLQHAGGFMVAVRSVFAAAQPVAVESLGGARPFTVDGFASATERAVDLSRTDDRPLAVSLVPPMLALLDRAGAPGWDLLSAYDAVLVGGAPAPKLLIDRLLFAGVHVFTSYGMTETCGGAVFDGRPLPGVSVTELDDGRLSICGDQVALGYRDSRFHDRWSNAPDGRRCFVTDDLGNVAADGLVTVTGRVDDVVQVGGSSVSLGAIRDLLLRDPGVALAEVLAVPDAGWGSRVVAVVVASGTRTTDLATELATAVESALGRPARPRQVRVVTAIPLLESGKPDRRALTEMAQAEWA